MAFPYDTSIDPDNAWNIEGFTAQNLNYPVPTAGTGVPFPSDVNIVTITAEFMTGDGESARGYFYLNNNNIPMRHPSTKTQFTPMNFRYAIVDGAVSMNVPATDNTTFVPVDSSVTTWLWYYKVIIENREFDSGSFALPSTPATVDFYTLIGLT